MSCRPLVSGPGSRRAQPLSKRHGALRRSRAEAVISSLLLLTLPKCPLCIAVYLGGLGLGVGVAQQAAAFVRPLTWLLFAACWLALLVRSWANRTALRAKSACSCGPR